MLYIIVLAKGGHMLPWNSLLLRLKSYMSMLSPREFLRSLIYIFSGVCHTNISRLRIEVDSGEVAFIKSGLGLLNPVFGAILRQWMKSLWREEGIE